MTPAPFFRKDFRVDGAIKSAVLHITALGLFEAEINGRTVGEDVFAPGWTDYSKRVYFHSHDVTALLAAGENAIGVILGDGWYAGYVAWGDRGSLRRAPVAAGRNWRSRPPTAKCSAWSAMRTGKRRWGRSSRATS